MARIDPLTAHMNARVRGMKAELLTHQQLDALLDQGDVDQMAQTLLDSPYKTEMAEALADSQGADAIEDGVSRNLVATYRKLLRSAQGHLRAPAQLFLTRWDLVAVKALLRNKHHGLDAETGKDSLIPGPGLTVALMNDFASRPTMDDLISALASWNASLCGVLSSHANEYHSDGNLQVLEDALDYQYFVKNARKTRNARTLSNRMVHRALRVEIDRINLRLLLQHRQTSGEADFDTAHLMPMGYLTAPTLETMVSARDAADAMEQLGSTRYADLAERLAGFVQTNRYAPIDRMMELLMIESLGRASRESVMSIAILMQFAWLKYNEVVNLRMIARGEARHLPAGRVREELMYA